MTVIITFLLIPNGDANRNTDSIMALRRKLKKGMLRKNATLWTQFFPLNMDTQNLSKSGESHTQLHMKTELTPMNI